MHPNCTGPAPHHFVRCVLLLNKDRIEDNGCLFNVLPQALLYCISIDSTEQQAMQYISDLV